MDVHRRTLLVPRVSSSSLTLAVFCSPPLLPALCPRPYRPHRLPLHIDSSGLLPFSSIVVSRHVMLFALHVYCM